MATPSIFLLNSNTFKKSFLSGDGQLELQSDQNIWATVLANDGAFTPDIDRIADVGFTFNNNQKFKFGGKAGMNLNISAGTLNQVHLIWPKQNDDDEDEKVLKAYGLTELLGNDQLYVRLLFSAQGGVTADGKVPIPVAGSLSATFGFGAGGNVVYEQLKRYDAKTKAADILSDLFASVHLPQQIDSVAELPAPGEVIAMRYGGYLKLNAGLNWGYQMSGSKSFELNNLKLELDYALRAMAAIKLGYQLAGDFSIEARRGAKDGWVRFVVRKNRDSAFNFTADFDFNAKAQLKGLPSGERSADEFLSRLIGSDADTVLGYFHKAEEFSSLSKLQEKLTGMTDSFIQKWSEQLIGKALDSNTFQEFFAAAKKVADVYTNIDQRILDMYHAYLDKIPHLQQALTALAGVSDPSQLAELINSEKANDPDSISPLELVQIIWQNNVFPLLQQNADFQEFLKLTQKAHSFVTDGATQPVRDFIASLKKELGLDGLFKELNQLKNPDDLKNLGDKRLQDLAGRVIGQAFDKLKASDINKAFQVFQTNLQRIEDFKNNWYAKLSDAVNQKFTFDLHFAYSRTNSRDALLDVEFDLNSADGQRLARAAAAGDFAEALDKFSSSFVTVNKGVFSHAFTRTAQLRINVLGWGFDSLSQLAVNAEQTIEQTSGGLLHVFATEASIKERTSKGSKFKETVESNFLLRVMGETFQPEGTGVPTDPKTREYLIQTVRSAAVEYNLRESDDQTTADELTLYLDLAEFLNLLTKNARIKFANDLVKQFPNGLGKVVVRYSVKYDEELLKVAFKALSPDKLSDLAKQTMRQVIGSKYTGMMQTNSQARVGFAYLSASLHKIFDKDGPPGVQRLRSVTLPEWFAKGAPLEVELRKEHTDLLVELCLVEKNYADRLAKLSKTLGQRPIPQNDLTDAARNFVGMSDKLSRFRENAFFAMFDKLVAEALRLANDNRAFRQSSMIVEITPPGAQKAVTKVLTQPR